jgi:NAD(P)-dependent dehydrogenase (short-subunit alcohol dehydrogenase family)
MFSSYHHGNSFRKLLEANSASLSFTMTTLPIFSASITRHNASYPYIDPLRPELSAQGKVVLITGGGQGIGLSIALAFAKANAKAIVILGRTESTLRDGKAKIELAYSEARVHVFPVDVTNEKGVAEVFKTVHSTIGTIDVCVSNASYISKLVPIAASDIDEYVFKLSVLILSFTRQIEGQTLKLHSWWSAFTTQVMGGLIIAHAFLAHRTSTRTSDTTNSSASPFTSTFINISSSAAHLKPVPGFSSYAASKFAMVRVTDYLTSENPDVKIVDLHPGTIESDMSINTGGKYGIKFTFDDCKFPSHVTIHHLTIKLKC